MKVPCAAIGELMRADALLLSVCPATGFGEALLVFDGPAIK